MEWKIWKYEIPIQDEFEIEMPGRAEILSVGVQDGRPMLWARVEPDANMYKRKFIMATTGGPCPPPIYEAERGKEASFLGTIQLKGGAFVAHIFVVVV